MNRLASVCAFFLVFFFFFFIFLTGGAPVQPYFTLGLFCLTLGLFCRILGLFWQAERLYNKALLLQANHTTSLSNYGLFLQNVKGMWEVCACVCVCCVCMYAFVCMQALMYVCMYVSVCVYVCVCVLKATLGGRRNSIKKHWTRIRVTQPRCTTWRDYCRFFFEKKNQNKKALDTDPGHATNMARLLQFFYLFKGTGYLYSMATITGWIQKP